MAAEIPITITNMTLFEKEAAGLFGVVTETGTTAITGDFALIQCLTATTFATLTETNRSGDAITALSLAAGTVLRGRFSAFTLTTGAVRAYKAGALSS